MKLTAESTVIDDNKLNNDIDTAQETANQAKTVADTTAQYFWFKSTGNDTGAHISEKTQAQFEASPSGGNLLARSNGVAVRDGLTELAQFGSDGVRVLNAQTNILSMIGTHETNVTTDYGWVAPTRDTGKIERDKTSICLVTTVNSSGVNYEDINIVGGVYDTFGSHGGTQNNYPSRIKLIATNGYGYSAGLIVDGSTIEAYCGNEEVAQMSSSTLFLWTNLHQNSGTITVGGHSTPIGSVLSAESSSTITTAGIDTYTQGASLTIPTGSWVITGEWAFNTGSSSSARNIGVVLSTSSGSANTGILSRQRIMANNNGFAELQVTYVGEFTSDTTVYVKGASSMTYTTASANSIRAVRIA